MDPDVEFNFTGESSFLDELLGLALVSIALTIFALLAWLVYRSMSEQRLPIVREQDRPPHVTWGGAAKYILTTPLLMFFWYLAMGTLFSIATTDRSAVEISVALGATIGGTRILAQFNPDLAHDVAKIVPLVMVSVVLIGGNIAGEEQIQRINTEFEGLGSLIGFDLMALIVLDYVVTIGWFLRQRMSWRRRQRRRRRGIPEHGPLARAWQTWRDIGKTDTDTGTGADDAPQEASTSGENRD